MCRWILLFLFVPFLSFAKEKRMPIDQVPMYGAMDRSRIPSLKKGDENLIKNGIKGFGTREKAADAWFSVGWNFYRSDDLQNAMRRFNQAWLLNPHDPKPFWGFAMVLHDRGKAIEAEKHVAKAFALGLRDATFLADYGRISTVAIVEDPNLPADTKAAYLKTSDEMYALAEQADPTNEYLYASWSTAMFWRGDYPRAWEKIHKQRQLGGQPNQNFIKLLSGKMPEPKD
jgi:hypothetical protein